MDAVTLALSKGYTNTKINEESEKIYNTTLPKSDEKSEIGQVLIVKAINELGIPTEIGYTNIETYNDAETASF